MWVVAHMARGLVRAGQVCICYEKKGGNEDGGDRSCIHSIALFLPSCSTGWLIGVFLVSPTASLKSPVISLCWAARPFVCSYSLTTRSNYPHQLLAFGYCRRCSSTSTFERLPQLCLPSECCRKNQSHGWY